MKMVLRKGLSKDLLTVRHLALHLVKEMEARLENWMVHRLALN